MNEDPTREFEADDAQAGDDAPTRERADVDEDRTERADDAPTAESPAPDALTPVPPSAIPAAPTEPTTAPIGLERLEEPCPNCGAPVPAEALVCVKCGWDFARNEPTRTREAEAAAADELEAAEEGPTAISKPGKLGWKPPFFAGAAAFLTAAILAGAQAWSGTESNKIGQWIVAFLDVLIDGVIRTGLGLAALLFVARILEAPFGKIGLAAARMTLAVGLFYLAFFLAQSLSLTSAVEWALGAGVGAALYYLIIMWMFSLERDAVLLVGGAHFILWLAVQAAVLLEMGRRAGFG